METVKKFGTVAQATKEMDRRRTKAIPELQLHASATLVMHGDPFAITQEEKKDLAGEIAQFCVPIDSKWVGNLKRHHIDNAFEKLKESVMLRLREHGVLAGGE